MKEFTFVSVKFFFISVKFYFFGFDLIDLNFYLLQTFLITNLTIQTIPNSFQLYLFYS